MTIARRLGRALVLLTVGLTAGTGCSSDSSAPAAPSAPAAAPAPEDQLTTPAAVAAGMRTIGQLARGIAESAGTDQARAQNLAEQIEPAWKPIEGTVKRNDQDTYLAMEETFAVLEKSAQDGDAAAAAKGAESASTAVQEYLSRYPG